MTRRQILIADLASTPRARRAQFHLLIEWRTFWQLNGKDDSND